MNQLVCFIKENEALIGFLGAIIGFTGVAGTIWALLMARAQTKDLESINDALPTRDIGTFPAYVARLTTLLESARNRILIVCDAPCYCVISDIDLSEKYEAAIRQACIRHSGAGNKLSISILWMDQVCRKSVLREQFCPDPLGKWKEGLEKHLQRFLDVKSPGQSVQDLQYNEFERLVEEAHTDLQKAVKSVVGPDLPETLPLYFWIADSEAIFAIPNYKDRGEGRAFHTRDARIVDGLVFISNRLREKDRGHQHP